MCVYIYIYMFFLFYFPFHLGPYTEAPRIECRSRRKTNKEHVQGGARALLLRSIVITSKTVKCPVGRNQ